MNELLKGKSMFISTSDCDYGVEIDFIVIVNENDYADAVKVIRQAKNDFDDFPTLSDAVCNRLEKAGIEYLMPDFDGI